MILTGNEINKYVELGYIEIDPYDVNKLQSNSYNVTLSDDVKCYTVDVLDSRKKNATENVKICSGELLILPGILYLARTVERTKTSKFVPILYGRSSLSRLGVNIHFTSGFGDTGFNGTWTLAIAAMIPTILYVGMEIGQLCFHTIKGKALKYKGRYQDQTDTTASRLYVDS